jgi:predicted MPP superfamily phosphohydrolase
MVKSGRRAFLKRGTVWLGACSTGVGLYAWQVEPHWVEYVERVLPIAHLPGPLVGARLVQLSDLHVGPQVDDDYVFDVFDRVREMAPDIVVYTGDFTTYHQDVVAHAKRVYARAPRGRLATVGIFGNHDYGPGWRHPELAAALLPPLEAAGIRVLRNEVVDVAGLDVVGLDDWWAKQFKPMDALAYRNTGKAAIVLSHNPDTADLPGWANYEGWILSGHTHGGQCKAPFLPPPLLPVSNRRYTCGTFDLSGNRRLYISRGVGHTLQVRFNVRPEVTVFTLTQT